ncbi:hypothetical protein MGG_02036 [Pyricularia oryzae 70-15]|uniref:C2H2-type domain-containing protein n=2 Tax=Pyricularia oryzae TaxID=318829 RepID=G4MMU4_PYRO7|nr:uncharacterized protein MGG_02036 [Pyricularia oryzae 70-15]EHA56174.1 hypothetical protein MGG_02036 [Pyricularia oryzae 70-15]
MADDSYAFSVSTVGDLVTARGFHLSGRARHVGGQISDESYQMTVDALTKLDLAHSQSTRQNSQDHGQKTHGPTPVHPETGGYDVLHTQRELWNRVLEVAGFRDLLRIYAIRVGAGNRLDGALSSAVRNYMLSHSTTVYETSYQPRNVGHDLTEIAFGDRAGSNKELFDLMRDSSLGRDADAPIYITKAELESFEKRSDMRALRAQYAKLKKDESLEAKKEANRIQSRLGKLVNELTALTLSVKRRDYFRFVDTRRASGRATDDLHVAPINPRRTRHAEAGPPAMMVGQIMCQDSTAVDSGTAMELWGSSLVAFLKCRDDDLKAALAPTLIPSISVTNSICLLCKKEFTQRRNLTRHVASVHNKQFQRPFDCPVCVDKCIINDAAHWSHHIDIFHGRQNAPRFPPKTAVQPTDDAEMPPMPVIRLDRLDTSKPTCLLCGKSFATKKSLTRHNKEVHHQEGRFRGPFDCPACNKENGMPVCTIFNAVEWSNHVETVHGPQNTPGLPTDGQTNFARKRKRKGDRKDEYSETDTMETVVAGSQENPGFLGERAKYEGKVAFCLFCQLHWAPGTYFARHLNAKHSKHFESPFSCPECPSNDGCLILDLFTWKRHISEVHGGDNGALLVDQGCERISQRDGTKRRREEDDMYPKDTAATKKQRPSAMLEDVIDHAGRTSVID